MFFSVLMKLWHLRRAQGWDCRRIRQSQMALLREIVKDASAEVPLYQDKYREHGAVADTITNEEAFRRIPWTGKEEIKANFPDRIVSRKSDWSLLYQVATSGTTGRVMSFQDETKRDWDRAADLLLDLEGNRWRPGCRKMIIPPDACFEYCGADEGGFTVSASDRFRVLLRAESNRRGQMIYQVLRLLVRDFFWKTRALKSLGLDGTAANEGSLEKYVALIEEWNPVVLSGVPQAMVVLARHLQKRKGPRPRVPIVRPMGGKMTAEMVRVIELGLSERVRENYGTAEAGTVAFDCEHTHQQHLLGEIFYVEFIRAGRQVAPGELGEIVITDLRNRAAPLIRYRIGDMGRYAEGRCACGFEGTRFTVGGRLDETIVTPAGKAFAGDEVADFFLARPGIEYVKVIQQSVERFLVEAVVSQPDDPRFAEMDWSGEFSQFLGYEVSVQLKRVRRIAPEGSGKFRLVMSYSFARFHATQA